MRNNEIAHFFKKMSHELKEMNDFDVPYNEYDNIFSDCKQKLIPKIQGTYKIKVKRIDSLTYDNYLKLQTILRDMYFKYNTNKQKTKINTESEKLLKVREENIDFELELAKMITGDNSSFPYRSSSKLTDFFQNLGHNFTHNGETRKEWVKDRLSELHIKEIHTLLSQGLFKKKYFIDYAQELNNDVHAELDKHPDFDSFLTSSDDCIKKAKKEFEQFIKDSITINNIFDLSTVLDMNVNIELLFDNKAKTEDIVLNMLIEESKERFLSNDKQVALEKLWDAFERLKTYFSELEKDGKDKKQSARRLVDIISNDFDKNFLLDEFDKLTKVGNNYRIRHHEKNKCELTSKHINYFFFRMMTVIDLCLMYLNEENEK